MASKYGRRHYRDLAWIVRDMRRHEIAEPEAILWLENELCLLFGRDNPRFSVDRFCDATDTSKPAQAWMK